MINRTIMIMFTVLYHYQVSELGCQAKAADRQEIIVHWPALDNSSLH